MPGRPATLPYIFDRGPLAALKGLEQAFGFEATLPLADAQGNLGHSGMAFRSAAMSVARERAGPQVCDAGRQFLRLSMPDVRDAHGARARAAATSNTIETKDGTHG